MDATATLVSEVNVTMGEEVVSSCTTTSSSGTSTSTTTSTTISTTTKTIEPDGNGGETPFTVRTTAIILPVPSDLSLLQQANKNWYEMVEPNLYVALKNNNTNNNNNNNTSESLISLNTDTDDDHNDAAAMTTTSTLLTYSSKGGPVFQIQPGETVELKLKTTTV